MEVGLYAHRAAGCHRDHLGVDRVVATGGAIGSRGARCIQCTNNLKQIGLAMHNYESIAGTFPLTGVVDPRPVAFAHWVGWSGHARILPVMEQGPMFSSINFTLPYSRADNYTVAAASISSFLCPSEKDPSPTPASGFFNTPKGVTSYGLNMGDWFVFAAGGPVTRGVFSPNVSRRFSSFTDGTSNTVLASETKRCATPSTTAFPASP